MRLRARAAQPGEARRQDDPRLLRALSAPQAGRASDLDGRVPRGRAGVRGHAGSFQPRRALAPVSGRRDLVLVDLRGTGGARRSGARRSRGRSRDYVARAGRCAGRSGPKRDLFSTSQAVQDLEAVLRALHAGVIDLYGDSYGTYAAQAYALRFPAAAAVAHARRRLSAAGNGSGLGGPGRGDPDRARAFLLALGDLPDAESGQARHPLRRSRPREPILGTARDGDGRRTTVRLDEDAFVQLVCRLLVPGALARPAGCDPGGGAGRYGRDPSTRRGDRDDVGEPVQGSPELVRVRSTSRSSATTTLSSGTSPRRWPTAAPRPSATRRLPARDVHAVQRLSVDGHRIRRGLRLPPLAVAAARRIRPTRPGRRIPMSRRSS